MQRTPPIFASVGVLNQWWKRYFDAEPIHSAGHLELKYGDRIREDEERQAKDAAGLQVWLRTTLKVDASERTCQTWRIKEWSTAGKLLSIVDVEAAIGDRLRLAQYSDSFRAESVHVSAESLIEAQPPVFLADPELLRQWYAKYHPDSGPIRVSSIEEMENLLGDEIRIHYADLGRTQLKTVLSQRRKAVLVCDSVAREWIQKYRPRAPTLKRPAGVLKRPAAAVSKPEAPRKRRIS